jgi:hypothetical protein
MLSDVSDNHLLFRFVEKEGNANCVSGFGTGSEPDMLFELYLAPLIDHLVVGRVHPHGYLGLMCMVPELTCFEARFVEVSTTNRTRFGISIDGRRAPPSIVLTHG